MSKDEFNINDMALEGSEGSEKLDMDLEGPDPMELETRIAKLFPDKDLIDTDDLKVMRMANDSYQVNNVPLKEAATSDLEKIDRFLKLKGG